VGTLKDWNFFNRNVQSGLTEGQFLNMGSVLLCAGPPSLGVTAGTAFVGDDAAGGDIVFPMGLISSWSMNQQMPVVPIPEAGSYKRYTITGPSDGSLALGRTLYHGPSLLRVLYAYYKAENNPSIQIEPLIDNATANNMRNPHNWINDTPGHENFWINMASSILSQPVGILLYIQDINRESYGAVYLEQFQPSVHGMASGPGQLVVSEQTQGSFARARPVKLAKPIPLMSRLSRDEGINSVGKIMVAGTERTLPGLGGLNPGTGGSNL